MPDEDLVQEGSIGLLEAIDQYDASRGASFESFARFRVRRAVRNALTEQARLIRLPKQIVERRRAIERAEARLSAGAGGRTPPPAEIAAATGLSTQAVLEARGAAVVTTSLDQPVLPDGSPLESLVADPAAADPEHEALEHEQRDLLAAAVARLPERKRIVVAAHWGLDGVPQPTAALAAELALSPRRTQTIGTEALYELRDALEPVAGAR